MFVVIVVRLHIFNLRMENGAVIKLYLDAQCRKKNEG